jgi:hypothetical protein
MIMIQQIPTIMRQRTMIIQQIMILVITNNQIVCNMIQIMMLEIMIMEVDLMIMAVVHLELICYTHRLVLLA